MRKEKLFIILAILTTLTFFTTAVTCTFCGINPPETAISEESAEIEAESKEETEQTTSKETKEEIAEETAEETFEEETAEESESTAEESTSESIEEHEVAPSEEISISPDADLSGSVRDTGNVWIASSVGNQIILGDTSEDKQTKGYLSFDIRELHGKTVQDAEINFSELDKVNNPEFAAYLDVKAVNYGNSLDSDDFAFGGVSLARIPTSSTSYTISGDTLKNELQKILESSETDYFQVKLGLSSKTNNDGTEDFLGFFLNDAWLYIIYID
jgi:hypothetical protein